MYVIIDKNTNQIVPRKGNTTLIFNSLGRVDLLNDDVAFSCQAGQEWPGYKLLAVTIQETGAGDVYSDSPPVYDGTSVIVTRTRSVAPKPTVISWEAFQDRFTQVELDNTTNYTEAVNTTTGLPLRPLLKQALARAYAKGTIDLTGIRTINFLSILVSAGIISGQRKAEILIP